MMTRAGKLFAVATLACLTTSAALFGCREEGPGERLGRAFSEATGDIAEAVEGEMDAAKEAARDATEDAAEQIRRKTDEANAAVDEALKKEDL